MFINPPNRSRRTIGCVLALAFAMASCSSDGDNKSSESSPSSSESASTDSTADTKEPRPVALTIGMLNPSPGLLTDVGTAQSRAVAMALSDINDNGGIGGEDVKVTTVDQPLGATASSMLPDLVTAGANSFIGPVGSNDAADVIPHLNSSGLVACSASATAPTLTQLDTDNLFFRTAMPDQYLVDRLISEISARVPADQMVTVVTRNDEYGNAVGLGLSDGLLALEHSVSVVTYNAANVQFNGIAQQVAATNPTLVVMVSLTEGPNLLTNLVGAGIAPNKMLGLDGMFDPRIASRSFPNDPAQADGLSILATTGGRDLLGRLIAEDPNAPIYYATQAYDCAVTLALSAVTAGSADPKALADAMIAVTGGGVKCTTFADCLAKYKAGEDIDYDGPSGTIAFDEAGDPSSGRFTLALVAGGQLTETKSEDVNLQKNALLDAHATAMTSAVFTAAVQSDLALLGFYTGPIDGIWDDDVIAAVKAFQTSAGLEPTGEFDEATATALQDRIGSGQTALQTSTQRLQLQLTELGFYSGPIDGRYTQEVVDAVKALQRAVGAPETGVLDVATLQAVFDKGIASVPTTTIPPTTAPPTTEAPPTTPAPPTTEAPPTTPAPPAQPNLLAALEATPEFSALVGWIFIAGLNDEIAALPASTIFAPINAAFEALDPAVEADWLANPDKLRTTLLHHIANGAFTTAQLTPQELQTSAGGPLGITADAEGIGVGGTAHVTDPRDVEASNGVIQGINAVLTPA